MKLNCIICDKPAHDLYEGEPCCMKEDCMTTIHEARSTTIHEEE